MHGRQCDRGNADGSGEQQQQQQSDELCHWQVRSRLLLSLATYRVLLVANKVGTHRDQAVEEGILVISAHF